MNFRLRRAAAAMLAASLVCSSAYASDPTPPARKHTAARKAKTPPPPTVEEQIQALRHDLESQINGLKADLADKDAQLKKAEQAAADAQASAAKAEAAASAQQQAVSDNAAAVTTLASTVTDLKANTVSLATTVSDETAKIKKDIGSPNALHYKGITLAPGGFLAAETIYRTKATGGDIPTAFSSLPYEHADAYSLSEFYGRLPVKPRPAGAPRATFGGGCRRGQAGSSAGVLRSAIGAQLGRRTCARDPRSLVSRNRSRSCYRQRSL